MSAGFVDAAAPASRLSPPVSPPFPGAGPVVFPEARDTGFPFAATGAMESLSGDEPCVEMDDSLTFTRCPRFDMLSEDAGPQPASPARRIRFRTATGAVVMDACIETFHMTWRWRIGNRSGESAVTEQSLQEACTQCASSLPYCDWHFYRWR